MRISARTIRRWSQPILFNFWFKRGALGTSNFRIDGFDLRIANLPVNLSWREPRVDRHEYGANAHQRVDCNDEIRTIVGPDTNPLAVRHASRAQRTGGGRYKLIEFRERPCPRPENQRGPARRTRRALPQPVRNTDA